MSVRTNRGFTLLEVLAVIVVLSLLASGYYGPRVLADARRVQRLQADVVAQEISMLGAAAQSYALAHSGDWPRQMEDCEQAHLDLTHRLPAEAFSRDTIFFSQDAQVDVPPFPISEAQVYPGRYYFDCTAAEDGNRHLFRVGLILGGHATAWAAYIANQLPNSEVVGDAVEENGTTGLRVSWPRLAALPAFDAFVRKDDPEFEGHLDVNGHAIYDVGEVVLQSGQTLAGALQYSGIARPGNYIAKPSCPLGQIPQIVTVPIEIGHEMSQPLTYFRIYASDLGTRWRIRSSVYGSNSESSDATRVRVGVFTTCS